MSFEIEFRNVCVDIEKKRILEQISFNLKPGQLTMVLGANGSGKSTLLKTLAKSVPMNAGQIFVNQMDLATISLADFSKYRAVLTQQTTMTFQINVEDIVLMGRYPHFKQVPNPIDLKLVEEALELFELIDFRNRKYDSLSGGEQQRVQFARVYVQIAHMEVGGILLLDEPLTFLDVKHQVSFLQLLRKFVSEKQWTVLMVIHDINLALNYGNYFLFLKHGALIAHGQKSEVQKTEIINEVFDSTAKLIQYEEQSFFLF